MHNAITEKNSVVRKEKTMISIETHFLMILFIIFSVFMLGFLFGMCFIADKEENYKLKTSSTKQRRNK